MLYTVGEMAKLLGIPTSTLRYYDKEGLLPFVERSEGGIRVVKDNDYEWLKIIDCLKKTGMPLKDIKEFILMAIQGDDTIDRRLELVKKQRILMQEKISEMQEMLDMLDFKCWYYETAQKAGTTSVPREMADDEIPPQFVEIRKKLKHR